ncbi:MAG: SUMF1/EgtB/PvdO family nonheme iron enzyme, partial [Acidobacteriota bacterium]|nr:SUMF1/EgtB/PvdO family nonheme iron enzyme [Acidobacteriota bacterium]
MLGREREAYMKWKDVIPWLFALAAFLFGIYQYVKRPKDKKLEKAAELEAVEEREEIIRKHVEKTCEELYSDALREELGNIDMLGSPDIEIKTVQLSAAFVSLRIYETCRGETRFQPHV